MVTVAAVTFVFLAGLLTAVATGLGALPFFLVDDIGDRTNVVLWGLASGIMLAASGFGLLAEGLAASSGFPTLLLAGIVAGVALVVVAGTVIDRVDLGSLSSPPAQSGEETASTTSDVRSDGGDGEVERQLISTAVTDGDLR